MYNEDIEVVTSELPVTEGDKDLITLLKSNFCQSLSGRSTLSYEIGTSNISAVVELNEISFRITSNTAKGMFNNDWISLKTIFAVMDGLPMEQDLTSSSFHTIFQGKSLNTSGFLLAALKEETLVLKLPGKRAGYERVMPDSFLASIRNLVVDYSAKKGASDIHMVAGKIKAKRN
jgi:hypothetical protein